MLTQLAGAVLAEAAAHEQAAPTIAPPYVVGAVMFCILLALMFICVSFMNLGNRHSPVEATDDPHKQHTNKHMHHDGQASSDH